MLTSPAYLERGANPTPMTRHIMTDVFRNMSRTVCRRTRPKAIIGPFAITVRAKWRRSIKLASRLERARRCRTGCAPTLAVSREAHDEAPSVEERIRGRDAKIAGCLMVNFSDATHAAAAVSRGTRPDVTIGTYRLFCALDQQDITP